MNTKTLAAYGLAAAMIGGSLIGATALLASPGTEPSTEVQIVQDDPDPGSIAVVTAPTTGPTVTSPPSALPTPAATGEADAADPASEEPYGSDAEGEEYESDEDEEYEDGYDGEDEYEDDHGQ